MFRSTPEIISSKLSDFYKEYLNSYIAFDVLKEVILISERSDFHKTYINYLYRKSKKGLFFLDLSFL